MKKLLIGLLTLASLSAFADCQVAIQDSGSSIACQGCGKSWVQKRDNYLNEYVKKSGFSKSVDNGTNIILKVDRFRDNNDFYTTEMQLVEPKSGLVIDSSVGKQKWNFLFNPLNAEKKSLKRALENLMKCEDLKKVNLD